jgi:hypothetical protein
MLDLSRPAKPVYEKKLRLLFIAELGCLRFHIFFPKAEGPPSTEWPIDDMLTIFSLLSQCLYNSSLLNLNFPDLIKTNPQVSGLQRS